MKKKQEMKKLLLIVLLCVYCVGLSGCSVLHWLTTDPRIIDCQRGGEGYFDCVQQVKQEER